MIAIICFIAWNKKEYKIGTEIYTVGSGEETLREIITLIIVRLLRNSNLRKNIENLLNTIG